MTELKDIILTIDTREQNQKRIKAVEEWALSHGAIVEHSALKLCDYHVLGEFRGVSVNIGIEAKSLSDFATSYSELSDKLARAYQYYDDVALFVEAANYTFTLDTDNFHAIIDNPAVRNGNANVLPLAVYENMLASFQREGIHVRQLRSELHFPYAIAGMLISITKPIHTGLQIKSKDFTSKYLNVLAKVPYISMARATKLINNYPNLNWLCGASEESYKQVLGNKIGSELYAFIRCHDLETDEWRNNYHMDGTEKDEPIIDDECRCTDGLHFYKVYPCDFADPKKRTECKTPDHFKHSSHAEGTLLNIHKPPIPSADTISSHPGKVISTSVKHSITSHVPLPDDTSQSLSTINTGRRSIDMPQNLNTHVIHGTHDTSSHPGSFLESVTPTIKKPDDPRSPPISEVKQEGFSRNFLPAEINLGLDDKPLKCVVKCRACHQIIIPEQDDDTGFCHDPECIAERDKPKQKMNLDMIIKDFMSDNKLYLLQEIVDYCKGWGAPYIFDRIMANVKSGNIKRVTEQTGKTTFQRVG